MKVWRLPWLITAWIDGDTCHGTMDEGWGRSWTPRRGLRLLQADGSKYDAPEMTKPEQRERAQMARLRALALAPIGQWFMVTSHYLDPDDFGRPLCSVELADGRDLAGVLIREGHTK